MTQDKTPKHIKLDERNHVEKTLLDQLAGLGWEICDLDSKQQPSDSFRQSFTEVVMLPVLREQLKVINPWLADDQVEEVIKQLIASFPGSGLIQNNRHVFTLDEAPAFYPKRTNSLGRYHTDCNNRELVW